MGEESLVKRVYWVNLGSNRGRGRPQRKWRDEVKESQMRRGREGLKDA